MGANSSADADVPSSVDDENPTSKKIKNVFQLSTGFTDGEACSLMPFDVFQTMFSLTECDQLGRLLLAHIKVRLKNVKGFTQEEFVEIGEEFVNLSGQHMINNYWDIFTSGKEEISKEEVLSFVDVMFTLACVTCGGKQLAADTVETVKQKYFNALVSNMINSSNTVYKTEFCQWTQKHCAHLISGAHSWITGVWSDLEWKRNLGQLTDFQADADIPCKSSGILHVPVFWLLSCALPHIYRLAVYDTDDQLSQSTSDRMREMFHWLSLYDSNDHGTSINRFCHHVFEYSGPTVLMLEFEDDHVYCLAVDTPWRESSSRWGGMYTSLIQILPVFRIVMSGADMIFMNLQLRGLPKGIQIGKDHKSLVLEINEELTSVKKYGIPYKLIRLEVWGCGSDTARKAQLEQRHWEKRETEKLRNQKLKIDDWKDSPDRQLLSWGGVEVTHSEALHPDDEKK
ncbi:uncharacterized protein LOC141900110 [Tubulanus polymorphus]|uniref:uncharacterized protein LOC141900110 n=1 Tax=Tubulanus polymorphus TaxID=672921 RepID=UPI003DA3EEA4